MADCRNGKPRAGRWRTATPRGRRETFNAEMNVGAVAMLADVRMALTDESAQVVDARPAERFSGKAPEPRPGLRSGHMPRLVQRAVQPLVENGRLVPRARIEAAFTAAGVDLDKPIITSCGSGVTRRDPHAGAGIDRQASPRVSTTARGRNGARGPTFPSNAADTVSPAATQNPSRW